MDYKKLLKNKNNFLILVILIIGVILIFISGMGNSKTSAPKSDTSEEARLEEILSDIKGAGRVSVMVTYHEQKNTYGSEKNMAKGAIITADGCSDPSIKSILSDAACAALNLPAHKVCVYLKK